MTDFMDGNIHDWNGGECPVPERCTVNVWLRNGDILMAPAGYIPWHHGRDADMHALAFQVTTPRADPAESQRVFEEGRAAAIAAVRAGLFPITGFYEDKSVEMKAALNRAAAAENRIKVMTLPGDKP